MPTIELHGFYSHIGTSSEGRKLQHRIKELLEGASYADEVVITSMLNVVRDTFDNQRPFLRIWVTRSDGPELFDKIRARLAPLDVDMEFATLDRFVERSRPTPKEDFVHRWSDEKGAYVWEKKFNA